MIHRWNERQWCDVTGKIGTKEAAIKKHPEICLEYFGEDETGYFSFQEAEKYLALLFQKCLWYVPSVEA